MAQQHAQARELDQIVKGSHEAHQARVAACLTWLMLHKIPAVPISTTGVPVARAHGGFVLRRNRSQVGISDVMACLPPRGRLVLLEVKTGKARRTPEQREMQSRFENAGAVCLVLRDVAQLGRIAELA